MAEERKEEEKSAEEVQDTREEKEDKENKEDKEKEEEVEEEDKKKEKKKKKKTKRWPTTDSEEEGKQDEEEGVKYDEDYNKKLAEAVELEKNGGEKLSFYKDFGDEEEYDGQDADPGARGESILSILKEQWLEGIQPMSYEYFVEHEMSDKSYLIRGERVSPCIAPRFEEGNMQIRSIDIYVLALQTVFGTTNKVKVISVPLGKFAGEGMARHKIEMIVNGSGASRKYIVYIDIPPEGLTHEMCNNEEYMNTLTVNIAYKDWSKHSHPYSSEEVSAVLKEIKPLFESGLITEREIEEFDDNGRTSMLVHSRQLYTDLFKPEEEEEVSTLVDAAQNKLVKVLHGTVDEMAAIFSYLSIHGYKSRENKNDKLMRLLASLHDVRKDEHRFNLMTRYFDVHHFASYREEYGIHTTGPGWRPDLKDLMHTMDQISFTEHFMRNIKEWMRLYPHSIQELQSKITSLRIGTSMVRKAIKDKGIKKPEYIGSMKKVSIKDLNEIGIPEAAHKIIRKGSSWPYRSSFTYGSLYREYTLCKFNYMNHILQIQEYKGETRDFLDLWEDADSDDELYSYVITRPGDIEFPYTKVESEHRLRLKKKIELASRMHNMTGIDWTICKKFMMKHRLDLKDGLEKHAFTDLQQEISWRTELIYRDYLDSMFYNGEWNSDGHDHGDNWSSYFLKIYYTRSTFYCPKDKEEKDRKAKIRKNLMKEEYKEYMKELLEEEKGAAEWRTRKDSETDSDTEEEKDSDTDEEEDAEKEKETSSEEEDKKEKKKRKKEKREESASPKRGEEKRKMENKKEDKKEKEAKKKKRKEEESSEEEDSDDQEEKKKKEEDTSKEWRKEETTESGKGSWGGGFYKGKGYDSQWRTKGYPNVDYYNSYTGYGKDSKGKGKKGNDWKGEVKGSYEKGYGKGKQYTKGETEQFRDADGKFKDEYVSKDRLRGSIHQFLKYERNYEPTRLAELVNCPGLARYTQTQVMAALLREKRLNGLKTFLTRGDMVRINLNRDSNEWDCT